MATSSWITPKAKFKPSSLDSRGLFAIEPIMKDERVVVWRGNYVNKERAEEAKRRGKLVMQWDEDLFSVEDRNDAGYYINHSCDSNLWMQDAYTLVARRNIREGEELTADYALWEADEAFVSRWECNCGSISCRRRVTGKDWQMLEFQGKYKGHFSPLINKRIRERE